MDIKERNKKLAAEMSEGARGEAREDKAARELELSEELRRVKGLAAKTYKQKENNYYGYEGILEKYGDLLTDTQKKAVKAKIKKYDDQLNKLAKGLEWKTGKAHEREMNVIEDEDKRAKVEDLITRWFKSKGKKVPSFKKGKGFVTSRFRQFLGSKRHKKYGAIDFNVAGLGTKADQQDFINFAINDGATVIDEKFAISQKRKTGDRNVFHVDFKPGGGKLIQEIPQGGTWKSDNTASTKKRKWQGPDMGHFTTVPPGKESYGGFIAPGTATRREARRRQQPVQNKALAEANIRIKELIKEDAKDLRIKEAKAIAYDDKIKAGGKEDKFSRYWRKFLPKYDQFDSEKEFLEFKETDPFKKEKEQITGTAKITVTDKDLKHFDDRPEEIDQKLKAPVEEITLKDKVDIEGSSLPFGNERYVPSHTSLDQLPEEMKVEDKVEIEEQIPESNQPIMDMDPNKNLLQGLKEGGEVKKYQTGELVEKDEEEAEFFPGQKQQFQQNIGEEIVDQGETVTGDKPLMLSELEQSETLDPKPPVEPSFDEKGNVVLTKQQEVEDVSTKSDQELKDSLKETVEVKSKPGSDTVTLSPRKSQVHRNKAYKTELDRRKQAADVAADAAVEAGRRETKSIMAKPEVKVDLKEDVKVEETGDPKAFDLPTYIQQTLQRDDEAREIMKNELAKANEAELNIQKVEPFRFWNNMSTPAKIVAGIGMLIGGYAAKDSPAGLQAVMNVIDGAVNADIQAQKLTQDQQLVVAKEATRRAKAAVDKYKAVATNPVQKAKLMELAQALEVKRAGVAKKQQLQALKTYVMNRAREGKLHLVPPSLMRMVYPKEDMKRIDTMRTNYEKERKDRKIQPVLSAYRRMHNLISRKEEITGMDDIAIVFSFMKLLDPGSVVRESEFETAANAGPRAKWFARQWNRFITGGRFTQADRKGFLKSSLTLVKPALDEEKDLQRKYISMSRRYGYPAAFVIPPSTRYFDLPGTKDDAAVRRIMKEQGKTRDEAESIHYHVAGKVKKPRYVYRKGVKYLVR